MDQSANAERSAEKDSEDLEKARKKNLVTEHRKSFGQWIGPGLITGAADDDPSGVGTYSVTGAQFGFAMLWLVPFCVPLMIAVQEMCGRIGIVTGHGLAAVIKQHYSKSLLFSCVFLLVVANVINIYADLNVMAASAKMLFGWTQTSWLTVITVVLCASIILIPYRLFVRVLKWLCLSLLAYVIVDFLPGVPNHWGEAGRNLFVIHWSTKPAFVLTVVGFLGTTISPYLFFWQTSEEVEDEVAAGTSDGSGGRVSPAAKSEFRKVGADTAVGMIASQAVAFFIVVCAAATLHSIGKTDINTAQDAALALKPLGKSAYWLFAVAIIGTGLLAIPTLAGSAAYAIAESFNWRYGLFRRFSRARPFYLAITLAVFIGYLMNFAHSIDPVKGLLYSAALNGVVAPPLIVVLLLICNNRKIVGEHRNGIWSNLFGWLSAILMGVAAVLMIYGMITGQS